MPIAVQCKCGKKYQVGDDKAGKKVRCKACQGVIAIPATDAPAGDEFDDFGDADFGAGGEFDDFGGDDLGAPEPRPKKSGGGKSGKGSKGKGAKAKGKAGKKGGKGGKSEMSPAVKYSLAGGIVVVTTAAVLGILYSRGMFGGGETKSTGGGDNVAGNTDGMTPPGGPGGPAPGGGNPGGTPNPNPGGGNPVARPIELLPTTEIKNLIPIEEPWVYTLSFGKPGGPYVAEIKGNVVGPDNSASQGETSKDPAPTVKIIADGQDARAAARRAFASNSLKQIALAMHNYHDIHGTFPIPEKTGLSWRVHLLPLLGENALYKQFKLDEPWDSDHNKSLITKMPTLFNTAGTSNTGKTSFHVLAGTGTPSGGLDFSYECRINLKTAQGKIEPETQYEFEIGFNRKSVISRNRFLGGVFRKTVLGKELIGKDTYTWNIRVGSPSGRQIGLRDIKDGSSNTVMAVAAGPETEVEWTKPGGLEFDPKNPIASLGSISEKGIPAACFDGRVFQLPPDIDPDAFVRLVRHQDGQPVSIANLPRKGTTQPGTKTPTNPTTPTNPNTPTGPQAIAAAQLLAQNPPNSRTNVGKTVRITGQVTKTPQGWVFLQGDGRRYIACKLAAAPATLPSVGQSVVIEGKITLNMPQYLTLEPATLIPATTTQAPAQPMKKPASSEETVPDN